jgi:ABC-2 type transport system permease protein
MTALAAPRGGPRAALRKHAAIVRTQLAHGLAYPLDLLSRGLTILIFMWVFLHLWRATFAASGAVVIDGLTLRDTLWYLVLAETIVLSRPRLSTEIATAVRDGSVAYTMSRPVGFLAYHMSRGIGDAAVRAVPTFLLGGALVWLVLGPPPPLVGWPVAGVAVLLAWLLDFAMASLIGLLAFWTEDVSAFEWIYSKIQLILGGVLIPLDFLPEWLHAIATRLPFAYTVWAPARLFVAPERGLALRLFAGQLLWLAVALAVLALFWHRAAGRLSVNGG